MNFFGNNCGCNGGDQNFATNNCGCGGFGFGCDPCLLILILMLTGKGCCDPCQIVWLMLLLNCLCGNNNHCDC